jgi:hypothetical protein
MKDILANNKCFDRVRADKGKVKANEAIDFFKKYHIKLKLTIAYNLEGNGKRKTGHQSIVNAFVKECKERILLYASLQS